MGSDSYPRIRELFIAEDHLKMVLSLGSLWCEILDQFLYESSTVDYTINDLAPSTLELVIFSSMRDFLLGAFAKTIPLDLSICTYLRDVPFRMIPKIPREVLGACDLYSTYIQKRLERG